VANLDDWMTDVGLDADTYSPDKVYTRATEKRTGRASTLRYTRDTIPPHVRGGMGALIASQRVPYKTFSDFVRDSIVHRLHYWSERVADPEFIRIVDNAMHNARIEQIAAEHDEANRLVQNVANLLQEASTDQQRRFALVEVKSIVNQTDDDQLRERLNDLVRRFS
jgi:hypothetical protein